ncbi:wax ester/triacylglycerol synthase domain-containing protein [Streptomyces sp. NPDC127068]|uniref:wax ester/triacylglycerol synthase domain-containing protein n=1 Tax=Streptomyces sp. NPDC127068 TaxID=3347127 RepID=UPI003650A88A
MSTTSLEVNFLTKSFVRLGTLTREPSDLYFGFHLRMRGSPPDLAMLRAHVADRVSRIPALTHRLVLQDGRIRWEPDRDFDITRHVRQLPGTRPAYCPAQALLHPPPDPARPLWGMWLQTTETQGWGLSFLAHHAVQDATATLCTLRLLLGSAPLATRTSPHSLKPRPPQWATRLLPLLPDLLRAFRPAARTPQPDKHGPQPRELAHTSVDVELLRAAARATGLTVNQVHLAALARALYAWDPVHERAATSLWRAAPCALLPVDVRHPHEHEGIPSLPQGNRIGLLRVPLPHKAGGAQDMPAMSRQRLAARRRALRILTEHTPEPLADRIFGRLTDPRGVALTASYVRMDEPMTALGARVIDIDAIPWLPPGHTCFTLLLTHGASANLAALTDTAARHPRRLVRLWAHAVHDMSAA